MENYPNSGIQHTRALVAIGILQLCLDCHKDENPKSPFGQRLCRIQKRLNECAVQTKKHALSSGATRAIHRYADILERHSIKESMTEPERDLQWAIIWCIGIHFVDEVRSTCPLYWQGECKKSWRYLQQMTDGVALILDRELDNPIQKSIPIYLEISDAMEAA